MKKTLAILLILIYSSTALGGVTINFHYCQGKIAKISILNFGDRKGCGCDPKDMPKDCCKDELKYQKSDNHRTIQAAQIAEITSIAVEPPAFYENFTIPSIDKDDSGLIRNKVQRSCPAFIYLLNRVFRI